jgi:ubiquinone/menaquinone biosynthesis C-methylase UbiE
MERTSESRSEKDLSEETTWEKAAKTRMGKYLTRIETSFVADSIAGSRPRMIMDVGAGAGKFSLLEEENSGTVVSIDIDAHGLKRLKLQNDKVHIIQADARNIPLKNEVFEAIFMVEVLDYISKAEKVFEDCYRTLKFNGFFVFSFGNKSSIKQKLRKLRGKSYTHTYDRIMNWLSATGFSVKRKIGFNWGLFGRTSENRLVPLFAGIEKILGLRRLPSFSPWVMLHVMKSEKNFEEQNSTFFRSINKTALQEATIINHKNK